MFLTHRQTALGVTSISHCCIYHVFFGWCWNTILVTLSNIKIRHLIWKRFRRFQFLIGTFVCGVKGICWGKRFYHRFLVAFWNNLVRNEIKLLALIYESSLHTHTWLLPCQWIRFFAHRIIIEFHLDQPHLLLNTQICRFARMFGPCNAWAWGMFLFESLSNRKVSILLLVGELNMQMIQ